MALADECFAPYFYLGIFSSAGYVASNGRMIDGLEWL
jgi:hypothetical protein